MYTLSPAIAASCSRYAITSL